MIGSESTTPIRVLRVISRLIIGGPTFHVAILAKGLDRSRFLQCLVSGEALAGERSMVSELVSQRIVPRILPEIVGESSLGRGDVRAIAALTRVIDEFRPHIVHTHTGKAGIVGRLAARASRVPIVVHTFHGHVLNGYWGKAKSAAARLVERGLARLTDRLIAVSPEVKQDLVAYGVAPAERIDVIPLGLDLAAFLTCESRRGSFRAELGIDATTPLVGIVGRVVPIKNHRLFLDAARHVRAREPRACFVVVGDGTIRAELEAHARSLGLDSRVRFVGWRRDLPAIYADLDVLAISSDNEGTPVSAIEAMAARRPVVSTRVGGVPDVIRDGVTGLLVPPRDAARLGGAIADLLADAATANRLAGAARDSVRDRYTGPRLVSAIDDLYVDLVQSSSAIAKRGGAPVRIPARRAVPWGRFLEHS